MKHSCSLLKMLSISGLTLLITGCMVGPDFKPLPPPTATRYTALPMPHQTVSTKGLGSGGRAQYFAFKKDLQGDWWTIFHSQKINQLIQAGLANNQNLIAAKAALKQADDTLYAQAGGLLLPSVNFNGSGQRTQINGTSFGTAFGASTFNVVNATFGASYLLDVWGASRRQVESYAAQADYQRYQMIATYLTLTTNIVTTAITIASLEKQIQATQDLIGEQKRILAITKEQLSVGATDAQAVLTQQTTLAQTETSLPPLQNTLSQQQHALAVLVGKQTNQQKPLMISLNRLTLPRNLPVSMPSKIIAQRPDIQASEALLHSASAQVGVATANLLPQITLSANGGWQSNTVTNFFSAQNATWSLGAGLLQPIFHGGQLSMQRKAAIEALKEARAQYQQTVLQAFQNVADALRAVQFDADELKDAAMAERSAKNTLRLTEKQYALGGQNYLSVLTAQVQYQQSLLTRIKAEAARFADTAALYQALGGGWWNTKLAKNQRKNVLNGARYIL